MDTFEVPAVACGRMVNPVRAAERLRDELEALGIDADVHDGYGLALVSVWFGLVVWTDGLVYRWRVAPGRGLWEARRYAFGPADDPVTAAGRVADRYAELRRRTPPVVREPAGWAPR
jgi:hypothetical protein